MSPTLPRRLSALAVCAGLTLAGCSNGGSATPGQSGGEGDPPTGLRFAARLRQSSGCPELLSALRADGAKHVGPYGFGGDVIAMGGAVDRAAQTTAAPTARPANEAAAPKAADAGASSSYSTTNVQEAGIDEPDLVKTDGNRILVLAQGRFHVVDISSGTPRLVGSASFAEDSYYGTDMLVSGNRVLVFGQAGFGDRVMPAQPASGVRREDVMPVGLGMSVVELDLSDAVHPKVVKRLNVEGSYLTARQVGSTARVVVNAQPAQLPFVYPQSQRGESAAKAANEKIVAQSTLADWLPSYTLTDAAGKELSKGQLTECNRVQRPTEFAGFGSLSILTFDMTKPLGTGDAVSVLTDAQVAYASAKNLYVATTTYVAPDEQNQRPDAFAEFATSLHAFDIAGTGPARYSASGTAPGHVLNQFSMSEYDGNLRVATTKGAPWGGGSESMITVLRAQGDKLDQIGQVGGLGKGERIYSVRFADATAYVVTFRQTDPFYTVDLSNPKDPKVLGELKIPGYSGYLHPIGKTLVLGVGQDATDQGRVQGTKVSLFDVSNLAAPKELSSWKLAGSSSQAEFDHHAFLYWDAKKIAVLPIISYQAGPAVRQAPGGAPAPFMGAIVLSIDPSGIKEIGRVTHPDAPIVRSLVAADRLVTVSDAQLRANSLSDLSTIGSISF